MLYYLWEVVSYVAARSSDLSLDPPHSPYDSCFKGCCDFFDLTVKQVPGYLALLTRHRDMLCTADPRVFFASCLDAVQYMKPFSIG